ncbi:MAG: HAMP domain-containing protein, partial [Pseudomonadota bacterium]
MTAIQEIAADLAAEEAVERAGISSDQETNRSGPMGWFAALTIGQKIRVFFVTNLTFALLAGLFVVFGFVKLGQGSESVESAHRNVIAAERLLFDLSEAQRHTEMFLAEGRDERASAALDRLDRAEAKVAPLRAMVRETNPAARDKLGSISENIAQLRSAIAAFDPRTVSTDARAASTKSVAANGGLVLDAALEVAGSLGEDEAAIAETESDLIWMLLSIWIGLTVTLTILTLIADRYLHRTVSVSLRELTTQMSKLASGDKDATIPGKDRLDEIGEMARAMVVFHRTGTRLERLSRERAERANAELEEQTRSQAEREEARLERDRALQDVADQFERTVGEVVSSVAAASSQLHSTSGSMAETAEKASARTSEVSQSMGEANRGATAAAAASDEFAMSIGEV